MGCFNETCKITRLPILADEHVVVFTIPKDVLKYKDETIQPIFDNIHKVKKYIGRYDDYGWLENIEISDEEYENTFKIFIKYTIFNFIKSWLEYKHCETRKTEVKRKIEYLETYQNFVFTYEDKEVFMEFGQLLSFCYQNRIDLFCNPYNSQYLELDFHKDLSEKILFEIKKMES